MIAVLKLFRLPLVFTAMADSAAGAWMAQRDPDFTWPILQVALSSAGLYAFGMAMNDIADRERDRSLHPERVLPSGKLSLRGALTAALLALGISLGSAVLLFRSVVLVAWLGIAAFILLYNFGPKRPPVMGAIRALNFLMGALVFEDFEGLAYFGLTWIALAPLVYVTALTAVSTMEEGETRRGRLFTGVAFMVLGAALPLFAMALEPKHYYLLSYLGHGAASFALLASWIVMRGVRARDRQGVMLLVRDGVAGILLLDATILLFAGLTLPGIAVTALLLPAALGVGWLRRA